VTTDAQLLAAAQTDAHAFREIYDRYAEAIHRFHLSRTRALDAALDLTAETFAQAWLSRARFKDVADGSAAPWLFAIARHVLVASVRQQRLEQSARERLPDGPVVIGDQDTQGLAHVMTPSKGPERGRVTVTRVRLSALSSENRAFPP